MSPLMRLALRLAVLLTALLPLLAAADPPARVGRLSLIEGHVVFRTDRQDAGAPATSNWPISSGAIIDTDRDGRAEIWIGSNTFRLNGSSRVEFTEVDDQHVALQVGQGTVAVTVRDREQATAIDIGTPAGQVRFGAPGRYRIDIDENSGDTKISSRDGVAYIYRPGGELTVSSGQRAVAYATGGWFVTEQRPDAFDDWADARDSRSHASTARRHVSPYMTGYEDLDRYGSWSSSPDYGQIWYPSAVPAGWAPYRYGRWAWIAPWGWTWIDEAPWGFAPFHYGRWVLIGGQWAWVPGTYTPRPIYAPALVAWIGSPGWSVGFSSGSAPAVGWFPLAPYEVFVPSYRCSPTYVRQVNVTNVTNMTLIERVAAGGQQPLYMHRNSPQAITLVPAKILQSGSSITQAALRQASRQELAQAPITARAPTSAWLPPATTALRPRVDNPVSVKPRLIPRPDNISPNPQVLPGEKSSTAAKRMLPPPLIQAPQSSPSPLDSTIHAPAAPQPDSGPSAPWVRHFNSHPEHAQPQSAPAPATAPTPIAPTEPQAAPRTAIQSAIPQSRPTAPAVVPTPKALPEIPRVEPPATAARVQPSWTSPPHQPAPAVPAFQAPAAREGASRANPGTASQVFRQTPPHEQRQEIPDKQRERAKMLGIPQ